MTYAVVKTGGKQYRVAIGDKLQVELLPKENAQIGEEIQLNEVLMYSDGDALQVGTPSLEVSVTAKVLDITRDKKLRVVKFRRRQNSRTRNGHRQHIMWLEIVKIGAGAKKANTKVKKAPITKKSVKPTADTKGDDLTKISGVGPVIVGKLENLGITTFQQVADFTAEDIERIDAELNFKGRIERDNWIAQSKEFLTGN